MLVEKAQHNLVTSLVFGLDPRIIKVGTEFTVSIVSEVQSRGWHLPGAHPTMDLISKYFDEFRSF